MLRAVIVGILFMPYIAAVGNLQQPAPPGLTMHTLEEIYQKLSVMENKIDAIQQQMAITSSSTKTMRLICYSDSSRTSCAYLYMIDHGRMTIRL
jgi:hypothetical protein